MPGLPLRGPVAHKHGRVVLITGAGSGIGRATAARFAARGDNVLVADIDQPTAEDTVAQIVSSGGSAHAYALDVTDATAWELLSTRIASEHGIPDVLVNNAGILIAGAFLEQDTGDWDRMISVNLDGVYYGSRIIGAAMAERATGAHIVNISSGAAWTPNRMAASYSVAKAGVLMLSESMRIDLARHKIGVSAICPGLTRTNLAAHSSRAGVDDEQESAFRSVLADAQARFAYAGPDAVARAIERAVTFNLAVVPVNPESYFVYGARRIAPGLTRGLLGLLSMGLADRAAATATARQTGCRTARVRVRWPRRA